MKRHIGDEKQHILLLVVGFFIFATLLAASSHGTALNGGRGVPPVRAALDSQHYDIGAPTLKDIYISPTGNNNNSGATREQPLRTLSGAWNQVPQGDLQTTGYQINLLPGDYQCEGDCINYFDERFGTYQFPIIIRAADGPGTATLLGGLNIANVRYLYLIDLNMRAGAGAARWGNNVLHFERGDHVLMRGLTVTGPWPDPNYEIQEVIKANQCEYLYLEDCDISGTYRTGVDYFSVQHGHILNNRIHDTGEDWGLYIKGGSAYLQIEGNEIYNCWLGFEAGQGSSMEFMRAPWLHYEAYDIKFINNLLHDIDGVGMSVAGGYNVLLAYNTLYRIGTYSDEAQGGARGYGLITIVYGGRGCTDGGEGATQSRAICSELISQGGWCTVAGEGGEYIPNRNVYVYNNLIYNPAPLTTRYSHLEVRGPILPPAGSNLESLVHADDNLRFRGNLIWNGAHDLPSGIEGSEGGCQPTNPGCNESQFRFDNMINVTEPQLINPAGGDFRPLPNGNLFSFAAYSMPDFTWDDAPARPAVPMGNLSNLVAIDRAGNSRTTHGVVGAYGSASDSSPPPSTFIVSGRTTNKKSKPITGTTLTFRLISGPGSLPAVVTSDASGNWTQSGFQPGSVYRATPTRSGYKFKPPFIEFNGANTDLNFIGKGQ